MKKPIVFVSLLIFIIVGLNIFFPEVFDRDTLKIVKQVHKEWLLLYETNPLKILALFMIFNVVMAMLPVPGISMISFLGGSIFGFSLGVIISSMATAIGNLGGFFLGRYFLREWVIEKYEDRVLIFKENWQTNGALALVSFRLFPLIPSFVANLVMGVSPLKWWTFFWVSWLGRIPMVLVYTYAGVKIASIQHASEVLHPSLFGMFVALAVLPWVFKFIFKKVKTRK